MPRVRCPALGNFMPSECHVSRGDAERHAARAADAGRRVRKLRSEGGITPLHYACLPGVT